MTSQLGKMAAAACQVLSRTGLFATPVSVLLLSGQLMSSFSLVFVGAFGMSLGEKRNIS